MYINNCKLPVRKSVTSTLTVIETAMNCEKIYNGYRQKIKMIPLLTGILEANIPSAIYPKRIKSPQARKKFLLFTSCLLLYIISVYFFRISTTKININMCT